jgi:hypothetical protein
LKIYQLGWTVEIQLLFGVVGVKQLQHSYALMYDEDALACGCLPLPEI